MNGLARVLRLFVTPFNAIALIVLAAAFAAKTIQERPLRPDIDPALLEDRGPKPATVNMRLYFAGGDANGFVRENRAVPVLRDTPGERAAAAVREWLAGPRFRQAVRLVPNDIAAPSVLVRRDLAYLNLPAAWTRLGLGSAGELLVVCGLSNTLLEAGPLGRVQLMVDGKIVESLGGHLAIDAPFTAKTCQGG